ncbi:MAG: hypothetical protein GY850_10910 [bacterium]|nr:hypothetical protein [bacterium]
MKPIYFPFTYVSDPVAEAISTCFGQFVVYCPVREILPEQMQLWINRGVMDVRAPGPGNDEALKTAIKNFQIWADLHRQDSIEKTAYLKTRTNSVPSLGDFSSSEIVADIKGKTHDQLITKIPDPCLPARIFLYFAQKFDRQNQELTDGLNYYDQQEADLMRRLKMEDDPLSEELRNTPVRQPESLADYMISDRLAAWARIFCQEPEDSGIFVTHSPTVMDYLLDRTSTAARIFHLESIPPGSEQSIEKEARREKPAADLARLVGPKQTETSDDWIEQLTSAASDNNASLSIYRVPDQTPPEFFARYTAMSSPAAGRKGHKSKYDSTLIALIEI